MATMADLKPCPFCGGKASYTDNFYSNGTGHCVYCEECGAGTAILTGATPPEELKAMTYRDWNRRTDDAAPVRHGSWKGWTSSRFTGKYKDYDEPEFKDYKYYQCSECYRKSAIKELYCPSCGSKMDKE